MWGDEEEMFYGIPKRKPGKPRNDGAGSFFGDLKAAMKKTDSAGAFAASGHDSGLPAPRLRVDGLDAPLAVPVPASQAAALVSIAEKAAFGRGEATIVDETVRKAMKIPGARCTFDNAAWAPALERLVQKARKALGVVPRVRAELHDLLVYEAGGHFSPHRDSEKQPGMFGTLVVTLPSAHSGGALEVRHEGETVRFESAYGDGPAPSLSIKQMKQTISEAGLAVADLLEKQDVVARFAQAKERLAEAERRRAGPFDEAAATREAKKLKVVELRAALEAAGADTKGLKAALVERLVATQRAAAAAAALPQAGWCAFYADCEHEIRTVESGYRVALTYNLIHAGSGEAPVPPPQDAAAASLKTLAARWTAGTHDQPPDKVCHFLKHSYTKPALEGGGWHALKGEDAALAEALHGSGAYDVFACTVEQEEHGCAASEEIGDLETTYGVWARPAGAAVPDAVKQLLPKLRFDEAEYTDKNYFCKIKAYQEDGGFDTGNEGAPYSKWYKATALVFWPKVPMLGLGASLRLLDAAIKGDAAAHAGYESAGAMAAACAALATAKRTAGKGLAEVVCCLARDGVPAAVLVDFVGDSLELARLVQRKEGYYASVSTDASWNGATVAHALCAGRDRLLADHSTTVNALQLPPGASVCLAQFGHSHTQFEAAFTKAMRRAATTSEAGAFAAFRILRALADTTSSYTGESAARLVDVVGDVLVQALSVTFPLRQITVPAYYRNDAARAATYVTEETDKARKEAKDAAAVTLTAALSALAVPGATTARCLAAAAPVVCANAARFDGIVAVPAAVAPLLGGARRNVLEPAAVSALEAIAAAAATAPAPAGALTGEEKWTRGDAPGQEKVESLLITLAATGGAGRRAALFDEEDAWTVVRAASSVLSGGLSNAVYDRTGRGQYSSKTLAKVVNDDLSLPRVLLAAMARVPTVTPPRWGGPVLELPRDALAAAFTALRASERRGATGQLDALAALVARTPAFDPLRAVAPAIEKLADVSRLPCPLDTEVRASAALPALCSLTLAPLRTATVAPPPLKDWKLIVDLELGKGWKIKNMEEFFADPVADKKTLSIRDDDDERMARKLEELQSPDAFTTTRTESRYGPRLEIAKVPAGQAPKEDIRARIASEELRTKDLKTLRTLEGLLPRSSGPPTAGDSSSDDEPEKKKQRSL